MEAPETTLERRSVKGAAQGAPLVSIVIPAFNEASRIGNSIAQIDAFVKGVPYTIEVIIVDDGSIDGTSDVVASSQSPFMRVVRNSANHGKGYSVRQGVLEANGEWVLFSDADLSAPIDQLDKLLQVAIADSADIVIGSRAVDRKYIEKHQSSFREFGGILFNQIVKLLLGLELQDTQCGFKLFRREKTRVLFEKQTTPGFGFDPEILFLASRHQLRIREVPVRWSHSEGSKVHFLRDGARMFTDLVRIRWNHLRGKYSRN
jgi:glycosyltransferase involved in cell wall biosynthesis